VTRFDAISQLILKLTILPPNSKNSYLPFEWRVNSTTRGRGGPHIPGLPSGMPQIPQRIQQEAAKAVAGAAINSFFHK